MLDLRARWTRLLLLGLLLGSTSCKPELGEPGAPLKLQVVPSMDPTATRLAAERLAQQLTQATQLSFAVEVPHCYIDLVLALGEERADIAFMNDMGYLLAHDEFGAQAALAVRRGNLEERYHAAVLVHAAAGITQLAQLEGKRIAIVDVNSVSGYILPAMLLRSQGIAAHEIIKAGSHAEVVRLVYDRKADAGFTYLDGPAGPDGRPRDARAELLATHPDVAAQVRILVQTDPVPNEPIVFGRHVPAATRNRVVQAMLSLVATPEGQEIFRGLHEITALSPVDDEVYDPIRKALRDLGRKPDELVPGGGILEVRRHDRTPPIPPIGN